VTTNDEDGLIVLLPDSIEIYTPVYEAQLAQVASGGGQSSMIVLSNVGPFEAEATVEFFGDSGGPLSLPTQVEGIEPVPQMRSEVTVVIPPRSAAELDVLSQPTGVSVEGFWTGLTGFTGLRTN
jgi:hypothetical protein